MLDLMSTFLRSPYRMKTLFSQLATFLAAIWSSRWWTKAEWWSAIGTVSAVVVALFGESIWAWFRRPKLDVSIRVSRPDCVKTNFTDQAGRVVAEAYYFRLSVKNRGKRRAEDVEVYAERLEADEDGDFKVVAEFPPMDLKWSHVGRPLQSIAPGLQKHCDLGYIPYPLEGDIQQNIMQLIGNNSRLYFDLEVKPNQGGWSIPGGTYRLHLAIAAANARVQRRVLEIVFDGRWRSEETAMFSEGIRIRVQ